MVVCLCALRSLTNGIHVLSVTNHLFRFCALDEVITNRLFSCTFRKGQEQRGHLSKCQEFFVLLTYEGKYFHSRVLNHKVKMSVRILVFEGGGEKE